MTVTSAPPAKPIVMPANVERHLVLVHRRGWQSARDFAEIGRRVRRADPTTGVFVINWEAAEPNLLEAAAARPTLVFSPGPLGKMQPLRGKIYQGGPIHKVVQLDRLAKAGVSVPRTQVLAPNIGPLDPKRWGEYVVVKPTDIRTSSHGNGIQLMRTERVKYIAPEDYPEGHPGRFGPMVVQQFIDSGKHVNVYRVLTLFGEPLYCQLSHLDEERADLSADDEALESTVIAIQGSRDSRRREFIYHADVVALAKKAYNAIPEVPLQGCDIIRDEKTGRIYVLELNPGGNTWHFSSDFLAKVRAAAGPEFNERRLKQLDAFGSAAFALVAKTRKEAQ